MITPTWLPLDTENVGMSVSGAEPEILSRLSGFAGSGCGLVDGGNFIEDKGATMHSLLLPVLYYTATIRHIGLDGYSKNIKLIEGTDLIRFVNCYYLFRDT